MLRIIASSIFISAPVLPCTIFVSMETIRINNSLPSVIPLLFYNSYSLADVKNARTFCCRPSRHPIKPRLFLRRIFARTFCYIEHHRHRSPFNFLVNLISGLLAYAYDPNKPMVDWGGGGFSRLSFVNVNVPVTVPDSLFS